MNTVEQRVARMTQTPLGSRVMLPLFGSSLFELIDEPIDDEFRLRFIKYSIECFYNPETIELWDAEIEPSRVNFIQASEQNGVVANIELTTGEEIAL